MFFNITCKLLGHDRNLPFNSGCSRKYNYHLQKRINSVYYLQKLESNAVMAERETMMIEKKVCEKCGLVHEIPADDASGGDDWKMIALSVVGIALIALIWIWVFRWGVPFVKSISG